MRRDIGVNSDQTRFQQGSDSRQTDQPQADTKLTATVFDPVHSYSFETLFVCSLVFVGKVSKDWDVVSSLDLGIIELKEDSTRLPYSCIKI